MQKLNNFQSGKIIIVFQFERLTYRHYLGYVIKTALSIHTGLRMCELCKRNQYKT